MKLPKTRILFNIYFILLLFSANSCLQFQPQDDYLTSLIKAAKAGDSGSQNDLGGYYLETQNYNEAFKWFQKSAEQDFISAYFNLGIFHINGFGTEKDVEKAISHFAKSYEKGNGHAALLLGYIYLDEGNDCFEPQKAIQWFENAAKHKIPQADFIIGNLYLRGDIVEKNDTLAFHHIRQAAYHGNPLGQFVLGLFYRDGFIMPRDYNLSVNWIKKAAEQGLIDAQNEMGVIYSYGIGVESNPEMAQYWHDIAREQKSIIENADLLSQIQAPATATNKPVFIEPLLKMNIKTEADSLYQRGFQLLFGTDHSKSKDQAIDCLTQATLGGNKTARALLAYCFATGLGVHPSKVTAANLFVGKGQIKYSIGKEIYTIGFEIYEDGSYDKQYQIDL